MPLIYSYLYNNKHTVQLLDMNDPTLTTRNRPVYQRPVTIYQGIDNPVVIVFKNQDQKPVDVTGLSIQAAIQDPINKITVNTYAVTFANTANGRGEFTFDSFTISNLDNRKYKLTFKSVRESDNQERPLYFDDNYQAPLDLDVCPAYYNQEPFASNISYDGGTITGNIG